MRFLIVFALLAFLAVGFVAARPAEDEDTAVEEVADGDDTVVSSGDEETQDTAAEESTDEEAGEEASDDAQEDGTDGETDAEDSDDDAAEEETTTTTTAAPPKKHVRPFWPKFGGHGPVVIRRRGLLLHKA